MVGSDHGSASNSTNQPVTTAAQTGFVGRLAPFLFSFFPWLSFFLKSSQLNSLGTARLKETLRVSNAFLALQKVNIFKCKFKHGLFTTADKVHYTDRHDRRK